MLKLSMTKIFVFLAVSLFLFQFLWSTEVKNPDKPTKGEWDFKPKQLWTIDSAGKDVLAGVKRMKVSEDGRLYVQDTKVKKFFIFSPGGEFIKDFGKKGEGPGEIKWIDRAWPFLVKDKVIIIDLDKVHYFTADGEYIRSLEYPYFLSQSDPHYFINETTFLAAPRGSRRSDKKIKLYDLDSQKEKIIVEFSGFKSSLYQINENKMFMIDTKYGSGVRRQMVVGYHDNRVYYGMNDSYRINVSDLEGKKIFTFELERQALKSDASSKHGERPKDVPPQAWKQMLDNLPKVVPYFGWIEIHHGLIYIFTTESSREGTRQIDIFSPEGKYLYQAFIKAGEGMTIDSHPVIKNHHLYLALEDEAGEISIRKYKIKTPTG